ncbi:DNA-binding transcriptional regulator, FadR family [Roseomonas rosea]|uniref:DNA-binding transcriptional regulator, FadR family n=1 Tax=Muricoccus roseus TaxID=198092 RepID=A0A1M6AA56_9PROT|nr:FCD domain-containing protein [Roseomonas rosea]SHI33350.1 DNA-binding transcriptional regulator, FadR family [Roseomonas rosea]
MVGPVKHAVDSPDRAGAAGLQAALERDLRAERWALGEKLPTERELGLRYGVARNTVRRALDALESQGLIVRHVGRGTFRSAPPAEARAGDESLSPSDVVECRLILEPEMISLAVARATQADIARMAECLRGTDEAPDLAAFEHWDAALHDAFALGTHNGAVIAMCRSLARVRERTDWGQLKARGNTAERRATLQAQHHAMVEAVRQRDRAEARRVMREHILFVQGYMFGD